jgi:hypothetical protein
VIELRMILNKSIILLFVLHAISHTFIAKAQSSVLQSGKWYKVAVTKDGVYKINRGLFKKMGFDPSGTDPRKIKIYGNAGGMLPQANSSPRPNGLTELSLFVDGESDGTFNSDDYILFYAQGPDKHYFNEDKGIFFYEKNLYSDKNYYFITVSDDNGKRIKTSPSIPGTFPVINQFENFHYHENDEHSELKSGREWYGERFDLSIEFTKTVNLEDIIPESTIKLVSDVMAQSYSASSFSVFMNNTAVLKQDVSAVFNTQYGIKGRDRRDTVQFSANSVSAHTTSSQQIKYSYTRAISGRSIGYLDYFLLQVTQYLNLSSQQLSFRSGSSLNNPVSTFEMGQVTLNTSVWDVSNPSSPVLQPVKFSANKLTFNSITSALKEFIAFSSAPSPELVGNVPNQDIRNMTVPNLVIVTSPTFKAEALRLAEHRTNQYEISTSVVTTEEIYNEFSSGRQDVTAIRDFVKVLYDKGPSTLMALLIMGKGSYDYKMRVKNNTNLVPIYESRNSLSPLQTYSSDDYYSFLQDHEGEWGEDPAVNHTMDISVGRLPVKNPKEALEVVDKLISYDASPNRFGKWRKEIVFVADDGDPGYVFQVDAENMIKSISLNNPEIHTKRIFLDNYPQVSSPSGQSSIETSKLIEKSFYDGALVINYTGHGNERVWSQEKIFEDLNIVKLENERLPLLVTATCEFGRQDDPGLISGAELCMLRKDGCAIGLVTGSRPVFALTNYELNQAFYTAFFQKENDRYLSLGEIFRRTKNNSLSGVFNRNFSLIGDPTIQLAIPQHPINLTNITTASGSTTLSALSNVTVKGAVMSHDNQVMNDFDGVVEATLFDKQTSFVTLGDENPPFEFSQWQNALFRGKATVKRGEFEFQFVVPKNINYQLGNGNLSLYAFDSIRNIDATGASQNFRIGSSEGNYEADVTPPVLNLYLADTTFIFGGITNSNTVLIGRLFDEHGINISNYGVGNEILGTLDQSQTFSLNDYYEADLDNFRKGTITFPLNKLMPGKHTFLVKAWDTYNNPVQSSIDFTVSDHENLLIESFGNYPNPFQKDTKLFFTHNRPGDDLAATIRLCDLTGRVIGSYEMTVTNSTYRVEFPDINWFTLEGKTRSGGLYFAQLLLRSLTDGSKSEKVAKMIMLD